MAKTWAKFDWEQPFLFDEQLSEEETLAMNTARQYAQNKLQPKIIDAFRDESSEPGIFREMGELGLLGPTIEGYGCAGMSYTSY